MDAEERTLYADRKFRLVTRGENLADGQRGEVAFLRHPGAVVLLPFVAPGRICLVRNWRRALDLTLWELPAGTLEPGEAPAACARRELAEETGYAAGRLELVREFFPSPGLLDERMYFFLATDLVPGPASPRPDERLEPRVVPFAQALAWALDGTIRDGKTLVALLLWDKLAPHLDG